jgi:hypothetical protein
VPCGEMASATAIRMTTKSQAMAMMCMSLCGV